MIYVDDVLVKPNPIDAGETFVIELQLHEEYENSKKYANKYPYRYGEKEDTE